MMRMLVKGSKQNACQKGKFVFSCIFHWKWFLLVSSFAAQSAISVGSLIVCQLLTVNQTCEKFSAFSFHMHKLHVLRICCSEINSGSGCCYVIAFLSKRLSFFCAVKSLMWRTGCFQTLRRLFMGIDRSAVQIHPTPIQKAFLRETSEGNAFCDLFRVPFRGYLILEIETKCAQKS